MKIVDYIRRSPRLKKFVHWLLIPSSDARPRLWVRVFAKPINRKIGSGVKIRKRVRMDLAPFNKFSIGKNSIIEDFSTVNNAVGEVEIGDHSLIGLGNVIIGPVKIGNHVIMAQNVVVSGLNHNYTDVSKPIQEQGVSVSPIVIDDDCWIGANVVIIAGVTIGQHTVIAAGAVVTKDIPSFSVAVGNPARVIKRYDREQREWVKV